MSELNLIELHEDMSKIEIIKASTNNLDVLNTRIDEINDKINAMHDYLMQVDPKDLNVGDCFELIGYQRNGLK